jgi:hypothetical protein
VIDAHHPADAPGPQPAGVHDVRALDGSLLGLEAPAVGSALEPEDAVALDHLGAAPSRGGGVRVRQLARATDDGYRSPLVPGLKASADAERLAGELGFAAARLAELGEDPPGVYAEIAAEPDAEEALWLAFLAAYLSPAEGEDPFGGIRAARVPWASGELPDLSRVPRGLRASGDERTLAAYRAWAERSGSQGAALSGEAAWTPQRRFDRVFERLALPGLDRGARYDFLVTAGRLGLADVQGAALHLGDDATTLAAKRVFGIGDPILLGRRAAELADEAQVPLEALDVALFNWGQPIAGRVTFGAGEPDPGIRATAASALEL